MQIKTMRESYFIYQIGKNLRRWKLLVGGRTGLGEQFGDTYKHLKCLSPVTQPSHFEKCILQRLIA